MPSWAEIDSAEFWKAADLYERANATLYREFEIAMPKELTLQFQVVAADEITKRICGSKHPYTWAIHGAGSENPHLHLMVSERALDGVERGPKTFFKRANTKNPAEGGAVKSRTMKGDLDAFRESWAEVANRWLSNTGSPERIDHRSYAEQGVDKVPGVHLGPARAKMALRGLTVDTNTVKDIKMAYKGVKDEDLQELLEFGEIQSREKGIHRSSGNGVLSNNAHDNRSRDARMQCVRDTPKISECALSSATRISEVVNNSPRWRLALSGNGGSLAARVVRAYSGFLSKLSKVLETSFGKADPVIKQPISESLVVKKAPEKVIIPPKVEKPEIVPRKSSGMDI